MVQEWANSVSRAGNGFRTFQSGPQRHSGIFHNWS